jgi:FkbM family methyltransferase
MSISGELAALLGDEPLCLADVGASYFLPDTWLPLVPLPQARFVLFDPVGQNLAHAAQLPRDRVTVVPAALSRTGGAAEFFLAHTDSGSSLYPPHPQPGRPALNHDYFFPLKVLDIPTATLAGSLDQHRIEAVHAIKLDTQGSELDIVKGLDAPRLNRLLLAELEVTMETHVVHQGAARLPDVIQHFERSGFRFVNTRIARKSLERTGCVGPAYAATLGAQHECDVLFVRDLVNGGAPGTREQLRRALRQQLTLLCAYYLHAEALDTLQLASPLLPGEAPLLAALEQSIRRCAEQQSQDLQRGEASLWHRDRT